MTNDRPYRKAMTDGAALGELERSACSQFDPELTDEFLRIMRALRRVA
jgi:HD-GYP domain-containing protein (c-di-GMP phosphodiesterase class II)